MKLASRSIDTLPRFDQKHQETYTILYDTARQNIMSERRRSSGPKAPTGLNDETAEEVHDVIHQAELEELKVCRLFN
jgi:hypothetical protein